MISRKNIFCTCLLIFTAVVDFHDIFIQAKSNQTKALLIEEVSDGKELKKLLRTKNNVLICFTTSIKQAAATIKILKEAASIIRGQGTMVLVDCSGDARKLCRKLKVNPEPTSLRHYKEGDFHKIYDRPLTVQSIVSFMRDPTGDIPWEEEKTAVDVLHLSDATALQKALQQQRKEGPKHMLVLFYAPWCGFCKQLKPEYAAAASLSKGDAILAAIDLSHPENSVLRQKYNITGFPTIIYFENGNQKMIYEGKNNKDGLLSFLKNPEKEIGKMKEIPWSETDTSVVHLTTDNFDSFMKKEASVLVMFYAPWCGHCKKMKPEYEKAAEMLKSKKIPGILAAVDGTKEKELAKHFAIKGYPTLKYFRNGALAYDPGVLRESNRLVDFMLNPKEPPPPPPPEKPWSEEEGQDVIHLTEETFKPFLRKKKHVLVMFYAPWCGHCKKAKPEFNKAAAQFRDDPKVEFAAIDCTQFSAVCSFFEVKGYPTIKYFHYFNKETKSYMRDRVEKEFVKFMHQALGTNTGSPSDAMERDETPRESGSWASLPGGEHVKLLTDTDFSTVISSHTPTFVLFYAPWCGHCRSMKADYATAAKQVHDESIHVTVAAIDASASPAIRNQFNIAGYPTMKLFRSGSEIQQYDGVRTTKGFVSFLKSALVRDEL